MHPWLTLLLLSSLSIINTGQTTSISGVTKILQELNDGLNSSLNIFLNFKDVPSEKFESSILETPSIKLELSMKSFNYFRVLGNFNRKTVIIVNIKKPPMNVAVANFLPHLLKELHELHIVFITEQNPIIWQKDLFMYCFKQGFVNALLIHLLNETTSLYSYNPYPMVRVQKISHIEEYLNRRQILRNFQHFQIRTVSLLVEPRMLHYVNRKGEHVHAGYMYNIMLEFIRRHNGTLKLLALKELQSIGYIADVMLGRKQIDFVCYPKEPKWNVSGTAPLFLLKDYIAVPFAQPIASYWYFAQPFTWTTWMAVMATIIYGMIMLYGSNRSEFGVHLLSSWCHLLFLPQPRIIIKNWQQFVIHFILILSGFILTNLYISLLKSMLTSGLFEPQVNTLDDLIHAPYRLITTAYYADYFKNATSVPEEVINNAYIAPLKEVNKNRVTLNTSFMHIAYGDRMDCLLYQQHLLKVPRFKKLPESIAYGVMSFPVASSLPYLNILNTFLKHIFESGIFRKMLRDSWIDTIESGLHKLMKNDVVEHKPFDLQFYILALALWAIGLTLASLCFVLESMG
ncbi:hypothetical protein KR044_005096 [Drosophila immigrans]|nr:hypothetical protein KR044_005096 [Drosophila immigrans]